MPDSQIVQSDVASGSSVYTLKGNVSFILKTVYGEFDGSGSASAFLPAVLIASDDGQPVAIAADQSVSVAAGASADVSFFPRARGGGGGSSTLLDLPWCFAEGNMRMDGSDRSYFDFVTPRTDVYDTTSGIAVDTVRILEPGTFLVFAYSEWTTTTGAPAVGTRVRLATNYVFAGAGGDFRTVHDGNLGLGSLDVSGVAGHFVWQTHTIDLVNVQATTPPVQIVLGATNTASSNLMSADTALTVVRVAETPLAGPL